MPSRSKVYRTFRIHALLLISVVFPLTMHHCAKDTSVRQSGSEGMISITSPQQFQQVLTRSGRELIVFDLYADWCAPCKVLSPLLDSIARQHQGRTRFYKINIDEVPSVSREFRTNGIPFVVLVKEGRIVDSFVGLRSRRDYEQAIERHAQ